MSCSAGRRRDCWSSGPPRRRTVYVSRGLVVEIRFNGVQRTPRYPGGSPSRFARVLRYREDKPAAEADTIASVRDLAAQ